MNRIERDKSVVELSQDGHYQIVHSTSGPITMELVFDAMSGVRELARLHGVDCVLLDFRNAFSFTSIIEKVSFAHQQAEETQYDRSKRVALLKSPEEKSFDMLASIMADSGFTFALFDDEAQAVEWLLQDAE